MFIAPPPVPRDIPLPLPADPTVLEIANVAVFVAHILFVNLLVGGALLTLAFQIRGLRDPRYDALARTIAATTTVNKSLAVVLGVAPLLVVSVLYTMHFYTANALTGTAWILLVPTIAIVFLLLYAHHYTWDRLATRRRLHIGILAAAVALLLFVPLVFVANVNLMTFPERWTEVHGFWSAVTLPNVLPRYLHFLTASVVATSLAGVGYLGRRPLAEAKLGAAEVRKIFYNVALVASLAQFLVGPLVLFTAPSRPLHVSVLGVIVLGVVLAMPAVVLLWREAARPAPRLSPLPWIAILLGATVVCMASGRHMYRGVALAAHRERVRVATEQWADDSRQAAYDLELARARSAAGTSPGEVAFRTNCAGCHAVDRKLVGPSLREIAGIYAGKPDGIVVWARAPGKKRPDAPQMPPFASVGDATLAAIADYMLATGGVEKR